MAQHDDPDQHDVPRPSEDLAVTLGHTTRVSEDAWLRWIGECPDLTAFLDAQPPARALKALQRAAGNALDALPVITGAKDGSLAGAFMAIGQLAELLDEQGYQRTARGWIRRSNSVERSP